jgi:hypothetical protein
VETNVDIRGVRAMQQTPNLLQEYGASLAATTH